MRRVVPLCLLLLITGCSRQKTTSPLAKRGLSGLPVPAAPETVFTPVAPSEVFHGQTAPQWAESLESGDQVAQLKASTALGELGEKGYPYLMQGMHSRSPDTRLQSLKAITRPVMAAHENETLPVVSALLRDSHPVVRRQALLRLGWFGAKARNALPAVRVLANSDEDNETRRLAVDIIIGMYEGVGGLMELLQESNPEFRKQAANRLLTLGPGARPALPALKKLADTDPDQGVRVAAQNAIQFIR